MISLTAAKASKNNLLGEEDNDLMGDGVLCDKGTSCEKPKTSKDTLSGGDGNDVILVDNKPAAKDVVVCGGGFSTGCSPTEQT